MKLPNKLIVNARITKNGIDIDLNGDVFPITYPKKIWQAFPENLKEVFKDNLAYSSTLFLTQILNLSHVEYKTARPFSEAFLFRMGIYDMPICAHVDGLSSLNYIRRFYNTVTSYSSESIKMPLEIDFKKNNRSEKSAIIPFSFGKESMLSAVLCTELGVMPIPVYVVEPAYTHEYNHKKNLIKDFEKETGITVHIIDYNPGVFRFGNCWGMKSELGLGLQCTEYAFMTLPFIHYFNADYLILGNEYSCNKTFIDADGVLTYKAGYDQHRDVTHQQGLLLSLGLGRKIEVSSFVEPIYELAETHILHHRYPEYGKYQMSCFTANDAGKNNRWCHNCEKCSYMFPLFAAFDINPKKVGFKENLFDKDHSHLYESFFTRTPTSALYGSQEEMGLAFYMAAMNGYKGESIDRFKKELMPSIKSQKKRLVKEYLGVHSTKNIPPEFKKKITDIFKEELKPFYG